MARRAGLASLRVLVVEYEKALRDSRHTLPYSPVEIGRFPDYFCSVSDRRKVHFLWRPCLPDVTDDMVIEAAVAGRCGCIVTFNVRDFVGAEQFGIRALPAAEFLKVVGETLPGWWGDFPLVSAPDSQTLCRELCRELCRRAGAS